MTHHIADDPTFEPAVRRIIRGETADMRSDISDLKTEMKEIKDKLKLNTLVTQQNSSYIKDLLQITKESMESKHQWQNHDGRIKATVTEHSRLLAKN